MTENNDIVLNTWQDEYDVLTEALPFSRHKTPEALEKQCVYLDTAGECLNLASKQYNQIKFLLETKEAEVGIRLRREAEQSGSKLTEKALDEKVNTDAEIISLKKAKMEAEDVKNRWLNRKMAFECRGRDLHDEVSLISCGYARS